MKAVTQKDARAANKRMKHALVEIVLTRPVLLRYCREHKSSLSPYWRDKIRRGFFGTDIKNPELAAIIEVISS